MNPPPDQSESRSQHRCFINLALVPKDLNILLVKSLCNQWGMLYSNVCFAAFKKDPVFNYFTNPGMKRNSIWIACSHNIHFIFHECGRRLFRPDCSFSRCTFLYFITPHGLIMSPICSSHISERVTQLSKPDIILQHLSKLEPDLSFFPGPRTPVVLFWQFNYIWVYILLISSKNCSTLNYSWFFFYRI